MLETERRWTLKLTSKKQSAASSKDRRLEGLAQAPPPGPSQGPRRLQGRLSCPTICLYKFCYRRLGQPLCGKHRPSASFR